MAKHRSFRLTQPSKQDLGRPLAPQSPLVRLLKRSLGVLALLGFVASLIVHAATFVGIAPPESTWLLHAGLIVAIIPMAMAWKRLAMSQQTGWSMAEAKRADGGLFRESLRAMPRWMKGVCVCCLAYMMLNSWLLFARMAEGSPAHNGNHYYLESHGRIVRDSTAEECHQLELYQARGFSGGWAFFYLIPAVFFLCLEPKMRESQDVANTGQPQSPTLRDS